MKKILIIDDSALMRTVLSDIINADSRFQVVDKAKDGVEGLELLKKNTYDAVVLDINMPRMDGITMLKEVQKNTPVRTSKVLPDCSPKWSYPSTRS